MVTRWGPGLISDFRLPKIIEKNMWRPLCLVLNTGPVELKIAGPFISRSGAAWPCESRTYKDACSKGTLPQHFSFSPVLSQLNMVLPTSRFCARRTTTARFYPVIIFPKSHRVHAQNWNSPTMLLPHRIELQWSCRTLVLRRSNAETNHQSPHPQSFWRGSTEQEFHTRNLVPWTLNLFFVYFFLPNLNRSITFLMEQIEHISVCQ